MQLRHPPSFVIIAILLWILALAISLSIPLDTWQYGQNGTVDFIQYYSAFALLHAGQNPYDPVAMRDVQLQLGQSSDRLVMMWNPPWILTILWPILSLSFSQANIFWLLTSGILFFVSIEASVRAVGMKKLPLLWLIAGAIFTPFYAGLVYGQASILPAVGLALGMWALRQNQNFLAGFAFAICSVKPHLFIVAAPFIIYWLCIARRFSVLTGLCTGLIFLIFPVLLYHPTVLNEWLAAFSAPLPSSATPVQFWQVTTLATPLRIMLAGKNGPPTWPTWGIPLGFVALSSLWLAIRRPTLNFEAITPLVLCLTVIASPYGWYYDQTILIVAQTFILKNARPNDRITAMQLIFIQIVALLVQAFFHPPQHYFVWIPLAVMIAWYLSLRNARHPIVMH